MHGEFRCHARGMPATHEVLWFTRLGDLAWRLAEVQLCLVGAGVAVGGVNQGVQMLQPPPSTRFAWFREQVRQGTKSSVQNPRLKRLNTEFYYQHQETVGPWGCFYNPTQTLYSVAFGASAKERPCQFGCLSIAITRWIIFRKETRAFYPCRPARLLLYSKFCSP